MSNHRQFLRLLQGLFLIGLLSTTGCATVSSPKVVSSPPPTKSSLGSFGLEKIVTLAERAAQAPYETPARVPDTLTALGYDQYRDIRFNPEKAIFKEEGLPFQLQFFHPGFLYDHAVKIHIVDERGAKPVAFSPDFFNYSHNVLDPSQIQADLGFAGFRIHAPINKANVFDEVAVFLGASYFRAVAKDLFYGLSARGVAVDTALPSGEEFPYFKEFWVVKPARADKEITVFALMDSPRLTGAYRFVVRPGTETMITVTAVIWLRAEIEQIGLAPLTSMFFYGENTLPHDPHDFRPEVHDSDGLLLKLENGNTIWRPAVNPGRLFVNSFEAENPQGFGLLQRDGNFDHYQDLESRFEQRPSVWIKPLPEKEDTVWQKGHVVLVQIPTPSEIHDNIVAFWTPDKKPVPGQALRLSYEMQWHRPAYRPAVLAAVQSTRLTPVPQKKALKFVIDFEGESLKNLKQTENIEAEVHSGNADYTVIEKQVIPNPLTGGRRLVFEIRSDKDEEGFTKLLFGSQESVIELTARLIQNGQALTETWSYAVTF